MYLQNKIILTKGHSINYMTYLYAFSVGLQLININYFTEHTLPAVVKSELGVKGSVNYSG